jgi:hypothetical protein
VWSRPAESRAAAIVENPLTVVVAALLIFTVQGWRIHTDVAPLDRIDTTDGLPLILQVFMSGWLFYAVIVIVAAVCGVLFWKGLNRVRAAEAVSAGSST